MNRHPLVSILLPIGREKKFLPEALESIRIQTFKNVELLTEEDRSDRGVTKTLISLARRARGELMVRMDADDVSFPHRLATQVRYLQEHQATQLVGSFANLIDEKSRVLSIQRVPVSYRAIRDLTFWQNPLIHSSWMMRRAWYESIGGYDKSYPFSQDWELLLRRVWSDRIENIPLALVGLRIHREAASFRFNRQQLYYGLKAQLATVWRRQVPLWFGALLLPKFLSFTIPSSIKLRYRRRL